MALWVQLVILASAVVSFCLPQVVLRAQLFVKVGARPHALWFRTHSLGYSGYSPSVNGVG